MSEIKLTIDGTEYEVEVNCPFGSSKTPLIFFDGHQYSAKAIPKQPIEEYTILSFRRKSTNDVEWVLNESANDGTYKNVNAGTKGFKGYDLIGEERGMECATVKSGKIEIYSVKRVSDGETFTVRDICQSETGYVYCPIRRFFIKDELMYVQFDEGHGKNDGCLTINSIEKAKPKQVLFTTEDGIIKHKGEICFYVTQDMNCYKISFLSEELRCDKVWYFHSKEKAEQYILENKPVLSLNDLLSVWDKAYVSIDTVSKPQSFYESAPMFLKFKELAKSKINPTNP